MKNTILLITALTIAGFAGGQIIKIQSGTAISKMDWQLKGINVDPFYKEPLVAWSFLAGIDYMDKKYFNLSSNIGMNRRGGKDEFIVTDQQGNHDGEYKTFKPHLDYLTINTCIDFRLRKKFSPFICVGPRFDYLLSHSKEFDYLKSRNELRKTAFGLLFGAGLIHEISKLQVGLRADYYYNFTKIAEWQGEINRYGGEITMKTLTINLSIGYKLK